MSNFRLTMPGYLASTFQQLTQDHQFDRQDLASLRQAAGKQQGSLIQEALETQTLNNLEARLNADADASLSLDAFQVADPQSMNMGHAIFEVRLVAETAPASTARVPRSEPSEAEQAWASAFEQKLKQGQPASPTDVSRYKDICERYLNSRQGLPAPSSQELEWANDIQRKAQAGQEPQGGDMARFRDIVARQALHVRNLLASQPEPTQAVTPEDLHWATELQDKVQNKHYQPSDNEQIRFHQLGRALQKFGPPAGFTPPAAAEQKR